MERVEGVAEQRRGHPVCGRLLDRQEVVSLVGQVEAAIGQGDDRSENRGCRDDRPDGGDAGAETASREASGRAMKASHRAG